MIDLPGLPSRYSPTQASLQAYIRDIAAFLQSPLALTIIASHPNQIAISAQPYADSNVPKEWLDWWEFFDVLGEGEAPLEAELSPGDHGTSKPLRRLVSVGELPSGAPSSMHGFLQCLNQLQLGRASATVPPPGSPVSGMSPKKSHEVHRLSTYIRGLCLSSAHQIHLDASRDDTPFVVDIGAGQGYLARELAFPSTVPARSIHVLALESDTNQIDGANRRGALSGATGHKSCMLLDAEGGPCKRGSITYKNTFVSSDSLAKEIESWILSAPCDAQRHVDRTLFNHDSCARTYPVIMTGLHACGSLTPTVLRSFVSLTDSHLTRPGSHWEPSALALVGCCYNLMKGSDFPMSRWDGFAPLKLTRQHLQLACQCPSQWSLSDASWRDSHLSRKKVVYRALLGRLLSQRACRFSGSVDTIAVDEDGEEEGPNVLEGKKLGRLNSSAYASWATFLQQTSFRLGLSDTIDCESHSMPEHRPPEEYRLPARLACLHTMRCLLGPVIESLVIIDRVLYLVDHLGPKWNVRAVNMFDLASGSARNVALVVDQEV